MFKTKWGWRESIGLLFIAAFLMSVGGCANKAKEGAALKDDAGPIVPLSDRPLPAFRIELLELAMNTATAIPVTPHIKTRSKTQEAVVAACRQLNQPLRAFSYAERIENWRKGACYADLAFYCASHGQGDKVQGLLDRADEVAKTAEDWRKDRIRVKIARTYALLGRTLQAEQYSANAADSETGKTESVKAVMAGPDDFEAQMQSLDELVAKGNFDLSRNAIESMAQLYNRFHGDSDRRLQVENKIRAACVQMPVPIRLEILLQLAGFELEHSDSGAARVLIGEARSLYDENYSDPEDGIPQIAKLAEWFYRAGDLEMARTEADRAVALFHEHRDKIVNIWRARALRPVAEAYQAMGAKDDASTVYRMAVEEGIENPNSRPRAEDLSATCCSMALSGFEPDDRLWSRMRQIYEGLAEPW